MLYRLSYKSVAAHENDDGFHHYDYAASSDEEAREKAKQFIYRLNAEDEKEYGVREFYYSALWLGKATKQIVQQEQVSIEYTVPL